MIGLAMLRRRGVPHRRVGLLADARGAYLIELAFILPCFFMLVMGTFDLGVQLYAKSVLSGSVEQAGRASTLETNSTDQAALDAKVRSNVGAVAKWGTLAFERKNYNDFVNVKTAEDFTDKDNDGVRDPGECFQDANNNGSYDSDRGANGQGGANDVVVYKATLTLRRLFPLWRMLGQPQTKTLTSSTVLRNQPYANQTDTTVVVCT